MNIVIGGISMLPYTCSAPITKWGVQQITKPGSIQENKAEINYLFTEKKRQVDLFVVCQKFNKQRRDYLNFGAYFFFTSY